MIKGIKEWPIVGVRIITAGLSLTPGYVTTVDDILFSTFEHCDESINVPEH